MSFIDVQNSSTVAAKGYMVPPFRTLTEKYIAGRSDDSFATKAKLDGTITKVGKDAITITYSDGRVESLFLGIQHGIVSGSYTPHLIVSHLKLGDKVVANQVITYNDGFFEQDLLDPTAVNLKFSLLTNVAFLLSADTHEDGINISRKLEGPLTTPVTEVKELVVPFTTNVFNLLPLGTVVDEESILCTLDDTLSGAGLDEQDEVIQALSSVGNANIRAKTTGTITRIDVIYHGEIENMSASLADICTFYDKERSKRSRNRGNDTAITGQIDETIRIGKSKVFSGFVGIRIYIDKDLGITTGDKYVVGNQLKATCSRVLEYDVIAEDGREVMAEFSTNSSFNRIVGSWLFQGLGNLILTKATENLIKDILN